MSANIKLIINADDFGINEEVNKRIEWCIINKCISSTTIMANAPALEKESHLLYEKSLDKNVNYKLITYIDI